jgi:hypothetical protein
VARFTQVDEMVPRCTQCVADQHPQTREFVIAGPLVVLADAVKPLDQIEQDAIAKNVVHRVVLKVFVRFTEPRFPRLDKTDAARIDASGAKIT